MNKKSLVVYTTRCGSTAEVAQAISLDLKDRGYMVDIQPVKEVSTISGYDTVVIGSPIRFNQWLPEAVAFVRRYQLEISKMQSAFFAVHILNTGQSESMQAARRSYLDPVRLIVRPDEEAYFTGWVNLQKLNLMERFMAKAFKTPLDDQRDWAAVHAWGKSIFA